MITSNRKWNEYVTALSATLIAAAAGTAIGWVTPAIPILLGYDSPIATSLYDLGWIISIMIMSSVASPIPTSYLIEWIGTKKTLLLAAVPYIISWILIMFANNVPTLIASRVISGLGYGMAYTAAPIYLGEIASDGVRGSITTLITVMTMLGVLSQYCIGPYVSMLGLASINIAVPILFLVTFSFMPESPYFYIKAGERVKAEASLKKLRGTAYVRDELENMTSLVRENMEEKGRWWDLISVAGNRRGLFILMGIYFTQQFCGNLVVLAYVQQRYSYYGLGPRESIFVSGLVHLLTSVISSLLVDKLGRRSLLLISSCGVAVSNIILIVFLFLGQENSVYIFVRFIPKVFIPLFIFSHMIGLATVPFAITSEVFPANIKSKATCVIQIFATLMIIAVTRLYGVLANSIDGKIAISGFGIISVAGVIFIWLLVPETKGQSFAAIQQKLYKSGRVVNEKSANVQS